jgi:hypothetical protein
MSTQSWVAKWCVVVGGGLGVGIALIVWIGQLNLGEVFSGHMPLKVVIALSGNAFYFLLVLLLVCVMGVAVALRRNVSRIWAGIIWLGIGGILAGATYISRFSIGPLLIPSVALFILGGILALGRWQ